MSELPAAAAATGAHLAPRVVPARHALAWYEDALRLFKRAPLAWVGLALITVAAEFLLKAVPQVGGVLSEILTPVVGCGLVYAAAAADRGEKVSLRLAVAALWAPAGTLVAVIAASVLPSAAQAAAAWWVAGVNIFGADAALANLSTATVAGIYAIGILASLPFTFVPYHALLERVPPRAAFAASGKAFAANTVPLLAYSAASLVLLGFCMLTMGLGIVLALPLWAASSYAAWKDVFGVRAGPD